MNSILILPITDVEPDLTLYQPLRQTRRFKYYTLINNPNQMEVEEITNASDATLAAFEEAFSKMKIGGKRKTIKNKRHRKKSRKSRRH